jgi:outer membrane receptor protein involved in Fe transport
MVSCSLQHRIVCLAVASCLLVPFAARAAEERAVEEILVTGSYIKRDNFDSPSPVSTISALDIEVSATTNMADIIYNQTQNFGTEVLANPGTGASGPSASSLRTGGSAQGGVGLANLRGLGERATMDLMDGHRLLFGDANFVYPQIAIERIEILLDGASALYGSEAIAGAVNYIPLKNYEGFKVQIEQRNQFDADAPDNKFGFLGGIDGDRGSALFALEVRDRERLEQREYEDYLRASNDFNDVDTVAFPGSAFVPRRNAAGAITSTATTAANRFPDPGCAFGFENTTSDPTKRGHDRWGVSFEGDPAGRQRCGTKFGEFLDWNSDLESVHGYTRFEYEFNDNVTFDADAMFGKIEFDTRSVPSPLVANDALQVPGDLAGNPFRAFTDLNANNVLDGAEQLLYARDNCNFVTCGAGDGFADRDINGDGIADPAAQGRFGVPVLLPSNTVDSDGDGIFDRFDPDAGVAFNEDVTLTGWTPFGKNLTGIPTLLNGDGSASRGRETDNLRMSAGLEVVIPDTSWSVDTTYTWGRRKEDYALAFGSPTNFSTPQLQASFFCVNPADIAAGRCQQFNPFSTSQFQVVNRVPQAIATPATAPEYNTQEEVDAIIVLNEDQVEETLKMLDVVVTGDLFELPAGPVGVAAGIHWRKEELIVDVNALNRTDTNTFGTSVQPQDAYLEAHDAFVEFRVPVFEAARWVGNLELQLAGRYTDNEAEADLGLATDAQFDDDVYKVAALWQPLDWMSVRASWGEGFVVPEIGDLFQGTREATRQVADPTCTAILPVEIAAPCAYSTVNGVRTALANAQTEAIRGNPELEPESSEAWNLGMTLQLLDGDLTLQADYFTVDYEDVLFQYRAQTVAAEQVQRFSAFYVDRCGAEPTTGPGTPEQVACATQARTDWILGGFETDRYTRDELGGQPVGLVNYVLGDFINLLAQEVTTYDLMAAYRFESSEIPMIGGDYGSFEVRVQGTYMDEYTYQIDAASAPIEGSGSRNDAGSGSQIPPIPEWRVTAGLTWIYLQHYARLTGRYHSTVEDKAIDGTIRAENSRGRIASAWYWDLYYAYTFEGLLGETSTTQLSLGIQNVFNHDPLPIEDSGGVDVNLDNPLGRIYSLRLSHEF